MHDVIPFMEKLLITCVDFPAFYTKFNSSCNCFHSMDLERFI